MHKSRTTVHPSEEIPQFLCPGLVVDQEELVTSKMSARISGKHFGGDQLLQPESPPYSSSTSRGIFFCDTSLSSSVTGPKTKQKNKVLFENCTHKQCASTFNTLQGICKQTIPNFTDPIWSVLQETSRQKVASI